MVIHDPTLDRTTDGPGAGARAHARRAPRAAAAGSARARVTDEPVPTLDEVVALAMRRRRQMLLEIKLDETGRRYPGIEEKVFAVLDRHGATAGDGGDGLRAGDVAAGACPAAGRARLRALLPAHPGRSRLAPSSASSTHARSAGVTFAGPAPEPGRREHASALVREAGLTLGVWTVNDERRHPPLHRPRRGRGHHRPARPGQARAGPVSPRERGAPLRPRAGPGHHRLHRAGGRSRRRGPRARLRRAAAALPPAGLGRARSRAHLVDHGERPPGRRCAPPASPDTRSPPSASPISARPRSCGSARRAGPSITPSCGSAGAPRRCATA